MFVSKKKYRDLLEKYEDAMDDLLKLNNELQKVKASPKAVIDSIFKNGLEWFDYNDLPIEDRRIYYEEARHILRTKVFRNEKSRWIAEGAQEALLDNINPERTIRDFQMSINGLARFQEILESIVNPDTPTSIVEDPYRGI